MTLEEMIAQEQKKAQQNQQEVNNVQTQQVVNNQSVAQQVVQTPVQQQATQETKFTGNVITTIASSTDENVNRDEFSLKAKKWAPIVVPEDFYTIKLVSIDKREAKAWDSDEMQPNFVWKFELISDSTGKQLDKTVTISKWCKAWSKGEQSNNYKFYEAFMQKTPEDGYNILDCVGKYARAYVSQYSRVDSKTGLKTTKSVIEKVLPLKK